jgi:hypothetical protein
VWDHGYGDANNQALTFRGTANSNAGEGIVIIIPAGVTVVASTIADITAEFTVE